MTESVGSFLPPEHTPGSFEVHADCRHYDGGLPCVFRRPCHGCDYYSPVRERHLIVLLEAFGDILITSPLARRIKEEQPSSHLTWLVRDSCAPLVELNPYVDRVLTYGWESIEQLRAESFDVVYGYERVRAAASLVDRISARKKVGIAHGGRHNALEALDGPSRQILMLDTWNDYRTRLNRKSWTELYFELAGFEYRGEPYVARIPPPVAAEVRSWFDRGGEPWACLNVGGSFPQKLWPAEHWSALGRMLLDGGHNLFFMGGPQDAPSIRTVIDGLLADGVPARRLMTRDLTLAQACAVPGHCEVVVTTDSFGYHAGLLNGRPCVVLFGPSTPAEVTLPHVRNVRALRTTFGCSPCAHQMTCGGVGGCMDVIDPAAVHAAVHELLD